MAHGMSSTGTLSRATHSITVFVGNANLKVPTLKCDNIRCFFYLTTLSLTRFIKKESFIVGDGETNINRMYTYYVWNQSNFMYRNYILNYLDDVLYNVY